MALKLSTSAAEMNIKMTNILKIENFINDSSYNELIEFSANFNTRLAIERRLRLPFLDPQTGVAQKHSNLHFKKSQRLPGMREGQIYSYPSARYRCKSNPMKFSSRPFYRFRANDSCTTTNHQPPPLSLQSTGTSSVIIPVPVADGGDVSDFQALIDAESNSLGAADTDSKDSQVLKDESMPKDWFYDEMDTNDNISEEQADSDFDYNVNGYKRRKKPPTTRKPSRKPKDSSASDVVKKSRPSSNSRSNRSSSSSSKKPSSSRSSKANKTDVVKRNFADVEPPSFDSVQGFMDGGSTENFSAYRSY